MPAGYVARRLSQLSSFAAFIGHPAHNTDTLCAGLHRFAFLLGAGDGDELSGEPTQ